MILPVYAANENRYECGMQYRTCGNSGIKLSAVSLGFWHNFGDVNTLANAREIVHYAFDNGINHFDLANNYGPNYGSAEETFGQIMRSSMAPYRDEMFITTKAGHDMWPGPFGIGSSRKYLMASLDQSLKRMNLDYVDLFYSHVYNADCPIEETMQALVDIVRSGKALYVGLSAYPVDLSVRAYEYLAARDVPCLAYQGRYNMLDRAVLDYDRMSVLRRFGVGFTVFSPLAQGLLTSRYLDGEIPQGSRMSHNKFLRPEMLAPELLGKLRQLNALAEQNGITLAEMSVAWLLTDSNVTSVIVGASSVTQLADNIKVVPHTPLSPELMSRIEDILK